MKKCIKEDSGIKNNVNDFLKGINLKRKLSPRNYTSVGTKNYYVFLREDENADLRVIEGECKSDK